MLYLKQRFIVAQQKGDDAPAPEAEETVKRDSIGNFKRPKKEEDDAEEIDEEEALAPANEETGISADDDAPAKEESAENDDPQAGNASFYPYHSQSTLIKLYFLQETMRLKS